MEGLLAPMSVKMAFLVRDCVFVQPLLSKNVFLGVLRFQEQQFAVFCEIMCLVQAVYLFPF